MRSSLKKALEDHDRYLEKMGLDKIRKKNKKETFVFDTGTNRNTVPTSDQIPVLNKGNKRSEIHYTGERKLLGIGLLHKSNLVPVWDETDAKEITRMRR